MHCSYSRDYTVVLVDGLLDGSRPELADLLRGRRSVVVTTPTVEALLVPRLRAYADAHDLDVHVVTSSLDERTKSMSAVLEVCRRAVDLGIGRTDLLVALGGGICCDVVSVAASLLRRGTPYACLPTTLLAQVDAGIGLKGGVNFAGRKNILGSFQPPEQVLMDPQWLSTLPLSQVRNGAAEIVKMAVVADAELFTVLESDGPDLLPARLTTPTGAAVIRRSIGLMLQQLQENCFEDRSFERLVDFGHTFSPTLEERSGHRMPHGEAVAVDIALSAALARRLGLLPAAEAQRIVRAVGRLGLPVWSSLLGHDLVEAAVRSVSAHRGGHLNLVVPVAIGRGDFVRDGAALESTVTSDALSWLRAAARDHRIPEPRPERDGSPFLRDATPRAARRPAGGAAPQCRSA